MNLVVFRTALDERVARYDLPEHPFFKAWNEGKLSRRHLAAYAGEYFHFVAAFPTFLSALHSRLGEGGFRRAVLHRLAEEEVEGRAHSDMWLDFAAGVGLSPERVQRSQPSESMRCLIRRYYHSASKDTPAEVLAGLYAYASQGPRIAGERARALVRHYGANAVTCGYFALHSYADVRHSQVWLDELFRLVARNCRVAEPALDAAGRAAGWLWEALNASAAHRMCERDFSAA